MNNPTSDTEQNILEAARQEFFRKGCLSACQQRNAG
jgi:hypothetical protein